LKRINKEKERKEEAGIQAVSGQYSSKTTLDSREIQEILPHRYPFLLVDKVLELEEGKRIVAVKNVTLNDYFFTGHFPGRPVMPGVLIIEALAQSAGVLMLSRRENRGKIAYFIGIDKARFRQRVVPGDQLRLEIEVVKLRTSTGQVYGKALVEGKTVAEANLMFALADR